MVHRGSSIDGGSCSSIDGGGTLIADARVLQSEFFKEKGYLVGTRDRVDLSYERPLSV